MSMLDEMILDKTIITKALCWLKLTVKKPNDFIKKEELEKLTYQKMCVGCPNEKYCHEEAVSCLDYEEVVDSGR